MRLLKYAMFLIFALAIGVATVGLFLPSTTQVERSIVIAQQPAVVFSLVNDLKAFHGWSPWAEKDPNMTVEFSSPSSGEGASMQWASDDPNVGVGSQTIFLSKPFTEVQIALDFGAMGLATAIFQFTQLSVGTEVSWTLNVVHGGNLMSRYMGLMMDKWVGMDFEKGLQSLKTQAEGLDSVTTKSVTYHHDGVVLNGFLAHPIGVQAAPAVLVVHEWWGHNDYAKRRAKMLAKLGYTAFALDMYGEGKVTTHPKEANAFMMEVVQNADLMQGRFNAALAYVQSLPEVDPMQIGAIGYCFGGSVVLNMARSGAPLKGVASFHGGLKGLTELTDAGKTVEYLVLNGADDPMVTPEQVETFKLGMDEAGVKYSFLNYPGAVHAFTNPAATVLGNAYGLPLAYNEAADKDSWQKLVTFLGRVFNGQS